MSSPYRDFAGRTARKLQKRLCWTMVVCAVCWCTSSTSTYAAPVNIDAHDSSADGPSPAQSQDTSRPSDTGKVLPRAQEGPGAGVAFPFNPTANAKPVPLSAFGRTLLDHGTYINLFNVSEYSAVTAGGINHGSFATNWAIAGVDLDLNRIFGVKGAALHFQINDVAGNGRSNEFNGATYTAISNFSLRDGFELRELTWDQHFLGDRLVLLAGRYNVTGAGFDTSEINCRFATFLCTTPRAFVTNTSGPNFQTSSWMADILYRPARSYYIKAAVFEEEPYLRANNHGSWPGTSWGLNESQGAEFPVELGYRTSLADDPYPREYTLGYTYDTIKYPDPFYNTRQMPLTTNRGVAQPHSGRSTIYTQLEQTIWRPTLSGTRRLIVFSDLNFLTSGYGIIRDNITVGLFDFGPFAFRPKDTFGVAVEVNLFNHRSVNQESAVAASQRLRTNISGSETLLEVNYGIHLTSGMDLTSYLEYIWHPDQLGSPAPRANLNHAVQVGATLRVNVNDVLGLPVLARTRF